MYLQYYCFDILLVHAEEAHGTCCKMHDLATMDYSSHAM